MSINHPIEDFSTSLHNAIIRDLPMVVYKEKDWEAFEKLPDLEKKRRNALHRRGDQSAIPSISKRRRPYMSDVRVVSFVQTWPTTSLGFSLKGEPDPVEAYTVLVEFESQSAHCFAIYFSGRLAYKVDGLRNEIQRNDTQWKTFLQNIKDRFLVRCEDAVRVYGASAVNKYGANLPIQTNPV